MNRPETIFKYEPLALRAIQNLKASSVYFGSPASFNDPYDCALTASIAQVTREDLESLRDQALTSTAFPQQVRDVIPSLTLEQFENVIRRGALLVLDQTREKFLKTRGVTCFSESNDNLLLWSHYGGQYKGFCLEFRTDFEPFNKPQKVRYSDAMPQFLLSDFIDDKNDIKIWDLFCTKSSAWAYEREWRVMHAKAGTLFGYEREALKAIYFGPDIDSQDRDLLCLIMYCQFPDAELWIGRRSSSAFSVEFEKISNYLPYAEARRRGLV